MTEQNVEIPTSRTLLSNTSCEAATGFQGRQKRAINTRNPPNCSRTQHPLVNPSMTQ